MSCVMTPQKLEMYKFRIYDIWIKNTFYLKYMLNFFENNDDSRCKEKM